MHPPTLVKNLESVRDYLKEHGWIKKELGMHGGPRCIVGAINSVLGIAWTDEWLQVYNVLQRNIDSKFQKKILVEWNDRQESVDSVFDLIDRAIKSCNSD